MFVSEQLTYFLEQNPTIARLICDKALLAQACPRRGAQSARFNAP